MFIHRVGRGELWFFFSYSQSRDNIRETDKRIFVGDSDRYKVIQNHKVLVFTDVSTV
jgi:hypothetical protein